ncbi:MAG: ATP-binding protein, partial [Chloroflexota bacterium]
RQNDTNLTIDVVDTGTGISEEAQRLIFVPFVQMDTRQAGVGLGLDIALQLVRLHGGDIHLESTPGKGSRFTIVLPYTPA